MAHESRQNINCNRTQWRGRLLASLQTIQEGFLNVISLGPNAERCKILVNVGNSDFFLHAKTFVLVRGGMVRRTVSKFTF